ncbi:MAG TPA: SDR family oxidoreductase [Caulobacteraceae bacterium]|nr:SDR family oxidoreductase [Caulobacteraceae bacterium]
MTILVTGGTKGIGLAIAERLARPGETLALAYRSDTTAAEAARTRIAAKGAQVHALRTDVGDIAAAARLIGEVAALGGGPLHIVHGAAMIYPTSLLRADLETFTAAMHANGLSLLYLVQPALPLLQRGSSIVFISSAGARQAQPGYAALGVGKALAESLVRYLAPELAPRGVRINAVAPGLVRTGSVAAMLGSEEAAEQLYQRAARSNPSGRMSEDADYAAVVEFLLGPGAQFVQGQVIHANGGAYVG